MSTNLQIISPSETCFLWDFLTGAQQIPRVHEAANNLQHYRFCPLVQLPHKTRNCNAVQCQQIRHKRANYVEGGNKVLPFLSMCATLGCFPIAHLHQQLTNLVAHLW
jgi:hypothetical protein